jgi:hypothetical protein
MSKKLTTTLQEDESLLRAAGSALDLLENTLEYKLDLLGDDDTAKMWLLSAKNHIFNAKENLEEWRDQREMVRESKS